MTTLTHHPRLADRGSGLRGLGYLVSIAFNIVILVVANNLLTWDLLPFLTDDFADVLWLIDISLLATILVNFVYLGYDPGWFKSVCQIGMGGISMAVAVRMYQVFPFDFSAYEFDWTWTVRFVMVLGMIGIGVGIVVELAKLARGAVVGPRSSRGQANGETGEST